MLTHDFVPAISGCSYYWTNSGFDSRKEIAFPLIFFPFLFLSYQLYRTIEAGDKLSRAMIASQGNRDADENNRRNKKEFSQFITLKSEVLQA